MFTFARGAVLAMDPVARMMAVAEAWLRIAETHHGRHRLAPATVRPAEREAYAYLLRACRDAIDQGALRPELTDAAELAEILWVVVNELIGQCVVLAERNRVPWPDLRAAARRAMGVAIHGILRESLEDERRRTRWVA